MARPTTSGPVLALAMLVLAALFSSVAAFRGRAKGAARMAIFGSRPPPQSKQANIAPVNEPRPFFVRPDKVGKKRKGRRAEAQPGRCCRCRRRRRRWHACSGFDL